jgi:CNT family concentrative nucleoside transporter
MVLAHDINPMEVPTPARERRLNETGVHQSSRRSSSVDSTSKDPEKAGRVQDADEPLHHPEVVDEEEQKPPVPKWFRPLLLAALATLILGWWISSTVLKATRHRWIVQTFFAWAFILIIAFRFIPNSVVTKPVEAVWTPLVQKPWYAMSYRARLAIGWLCLLGIVFGSAFGFPLEQGTKYGDRAINVLGLFIFQLGFWLTSKNRSQVPWPTVIVGLFLQQVIALFVLKTGAGFKIFHWIATLAGDFLNQALAGAAFFFDQETVATKHWFFVNTACLIRNKLLRRSPDETLLAAVFYHLLHCLRPDDVLSRRYAMDD